MRVPMSWLRELVTLPPNVTTAQVADALARAGLQVERIERYHHEPLIGGEQDELPLFHARSLFRDTEFTQ